LKTETSNRKTTAGQRVRFLFSAFPSTDCGHNYMGQYYMYTPMSHCKSIWR